MAVNLWYRAGIFDQHDCEIKRVHFDTRRDDSLARFDVIEMSDHPVILALT